MDCVDEGWIVGARVGLGARLDFGGEVRLGARLWIVGARLGLERGVIETALSGGAARKCVKWRIFKTRFSFLLIFAIGK